MAAHSLPCREPVRWQFHDKWRIFALKEEFAEQQTHQDSHDDANEVKGGNDESSIFQREEYSTDHDIDRYACRTTHHGDDQHGDETGALAFYGPSSHNRRDITAESHDQRDERLAVESHLMHQLIHDEGCTCHIA